MNTLTKSPIFAANYKKDCMKRTIFFVFFASLVVLSISAQNWDINTLHKINSWDGKFIRNYNKIISRTEPYIAVGVPVAMVLAAGVKKDRELLKDAVYVGTSVAGAFVVTYGLKYLIDRERPFDRYPDRVHAYSHETSPSFPSGHTLSSVIAASILTAADRRFGYAVVPLAALIAFSRLYLFVHFSTDVLASVILGLVIGHLVWKYGSILLNKIMPQQENM